MRKIVPVVAAGVTAFAVAGGGYAYATVDKAITLSIDGQPLRVTTRAGTVADLLESRDIAVGGHDVVRPSPDTKLAPGSEVTVRFGREVTFSIDGQAKTVWTTATNVHEAVSALPEATADAKVSLPPELSIGRSGATVEIATAKSVAVLVAGRRRVVSTTATTVRELLAAQHIALDADDELTPAATSRLVDGTTVRLARIAVRDQTTTRAVPHPTVQRDAPQLPAGTTKLDQAGVDGAERVTLRVIRTDGKLTGQQQTGTKVVRQPTPEIVLVGSKKAKSESSSGGSGASGGVWDKIAKCESGGNWSINTGNGYYGGLQFNLGTWHAYGGSGKPNNAGKAAQIAIAKKVQRAQGWGAWSGCSARLGLR